MSRSYSNVDLSTVKRLRLTSADRAVILRAFASRLQELPHPKRGARWEEADAALSYERRKVVSLAFAMFTIRDHGGRRERHTWRLEDEIDARWCNEQAKKLDEAPGTS